MRNCRVQEKIVERKKNLNFDSEQTIPLREELNSLLETLEQDIDVCLEEVK